MKFEVGDRVIILSCNEAGTVDHVDCAGYGQHIRVIPDNPEKFVPKPKGTLQTPYHPLRITETKAISGLYLRVGASLILSGPQFGMNFLLKLSSMSNLLQSIWNISRNPTVPNTFT
jgi:hypothetical protein